MRRYLVTGGAGFIGSTLCDRLIERGAEVIVVDNFISGKVENLCLSRGESAAGPANSYRRRCPRDQVAGASFGRPDAVIHLAALISGYESLTAPDDYVDANISACLRVIEFVAANKVPRIIFASSSTVYGDSRSLVLTEAAAPSPLTVYAVTKLTGEHLLSLYSRRFARLLLLLP